VFLQPGPDDLTTLQQYQGWQRQVSDGVVQDLNMSQARPKPPTHQTEMQPATTSNRFQPQVKSERTEIAENIIFSKP
jgi:hypothetical protein